MTLDPEKFIVRDEVFPDKEPYPLYPQQEEYPEFCVLTVKSLLEAQPKSANQLASLVGKAIIEDSLSSPPLNALRDNDERVRYGIMRDRNKAASTRAKGRNRASYQRFLGREGLDPNRPFEKQFNYMLEEPGEDGTRHLRVPLARISNDSTDDPHLATHNIGIARIHHTGDTPSNGESSCDGEHLWSLISQNFRMALDTKNTKPERIKAAYQTYYFLSHDCPFRRRSATLTRIALAYLEEKIGFDVPLTKKGIDLNMEALFRSLDSFMQGIETGEFSDKDVTAAEVLAWHKKASLAHSKMEREGKVYQAPYERIYSGLLNRDPAMLAWVSDNGLDIDLFAKKDNYSRFARVALIRQAQGTPLTLLPPQVRDSSTTSR